MFNNIYQDATFYLCNGITLQDKNRLLDTLDKIKLENKEQEFINKVVRTNNEDILFKLIMQNSIFFLEWLGIEYWNWNVYYFYKDSEIGTQENLFSLCRADRDFEKFINSYKLKEDIRELVFQAMYSFGLEYYTKEQLVDRIKELA